ncbi:MAG: hypothetical protein IH942_02935 [Acidobacteria bacterium]|nr:hypothetical protein [Acidobacteriota bacterium]
MPLAALALFAAACGPASSEPVTPTLDSTTATSAPTSTTLPAPRPHVVEELWIQVWAAATELDATVASLADVATPEVAAAMIAAVQGDDGVQRTLIHFPVIGDPVPDGSVEVNDCLTIDPRLPETTGDFWYRGSAAFDGDGTPRFASLKEMSHGCVPAELATPAIAAYEDYWDAQMEFLNPVDADHPRLFETTTGDLLAEFLRTLPPLEAEGIEVRGRPETHPWILSYNSPTEILIADCQLVHPEDGAYVIATGERRDDLIPPIVDGQRDQLRASVWFVDGRWKVGAVSGELDFGCEFDDFGDPKV